MLRLLLLLWFLRLFKPEWTLSFYVPALSPLRGLPTALLYGLFAYVATTYRKRLRIDKPYIFFLLAIAMSTLFANSTGLAMKALSTTVDNCLLYIVTLTIVLNTEEDSDSTIRALFNMYLAAFSFYGVIGLFNKGLVPFHVLLNNEDAFGPFMVLGVAFAAALAFKGNLKDYRSMLVSLLCLAGLVASFARGAFLSLCGVAAYFWLRSENRVRAALVGAGLGLSLVLFANLFFNQGEYWREMGTIGQSLEDETQEGRHFLAKKAIQMFEEFPLIGVGPYNYGHVLSQIITETEAQKKNVQRGHMYYRVPHSIYTQTLAELGLLGAMALMVMVGSFWRKMCVLRKMRAERSHDRTVDRSTDFSAHTLALELAMVGYLLNGFFYDLLFYHWLPDLLILASLIYYRQQVRTLGASHNWQEAVRIGSLRPSNAAT